MGWRRGGAQAGWPGLWVLLAAVAWMAVAPVPVVAAGPADAGTSSIIGTWASTSGPERLVFMPGGYFRSCFAAGQQGNAAMGQWKRLSAGRYSVEFTHTATPDCKGPLQPIRKHAASILGQVQVGKGELALYVSGEFPPDLYRPVAAAGPK